MAGAPETSPGLARSADASTADRLLDAATEAFGTRGYEATSLDDLAASLGLRKQTILYYHPSKSALLVAVLDRSGEELATALRQATTRPAQGFARIEAVVRAVFRLAVRRPAILGLLTEARRLDAAAARRLLAPLEPLAAEAERWLAGEMDAGRLRRSDPRMLLLSIYAAVVGVATELEVAQTIGGEVTLRSMVVRRRELLRFLAAAVEP